MKTAALILFSLLLMGCSDAATNGSGSPPSVAPKHVRGDDVVAEYLRRDAAPYRKSTVRFTITADDGSVKTYVMDVSRRQRDEETATFTQITSPSEDSDLASLTIESADRPTVVTTYAASFNEFRETDTNKMFFGGLTAGELLGEWGKFGYKLLNQEESNGNPIFRLEGKLKPSSTGLVERTEVAMRGDIYVPEMLQLFDSSGRRIRTFRVIEVGTDDHGAYAAKTEVENPVYKTKVAIEILGREFPEKIDDSAFTRERLKSIAARR